MFSDLCHKWPHVTKEESYVTPLESHVTPLYIYIIYYNVMHQQQLLVLYTLDVEEKGFLRSMLLNNVLPEEGATVIIPI